MFPRVLYRLPENEVRYSAKEMPKMQRDIREQWLSQDVHVIVKYWEIFIDKNLDISSCTLSLH